MLELDSTHNKRFISDVSSHIAPPKRANLFSLSLPVFLLLEVSLFVTLILLET